MKIDNNKKITPQDPSRMNPLRRLSRLFRYGDRIWDAAIRLMALLTLSIILLVGGLLWQQSADARALFGLDFILPSADSAWNPVDNNFRSWPFLYGTLITSLTAIILALPVGLGVAIFLAEICPRWLQTPLGVLIELLAAIPSVIYGLWGIYVFLPEVVTPAGLFLGTSLGNVPGLNIFFSGSIPLSGASRLAAGFILAIMIIPTIAAVTRDVFLAIPPAQREASFALGATRWETITRVLVPYGISGILGAVILGLGRAIGETMAVTMVIGNSIDSTLSLLRPGYTLSSIIANEFAEAVSSMHSQVLIEVALVLFVTTLVLNGFARYLVWQTGRHNRQEARV